MTEQATDRGPAPQIVGRGIDHLVLPVRDLAIARRFYEALGFTTTPDAVHPWGTGNFLVQLQGSFLEILGIVAPEKIVAPQPGHFSFGAYNHDFLTRHEGFSMLAFESGDARADQREFAAKGLETYAPFDFERKARLPDGAEVTVGFSLAFVTDSRLPEAVFFTCQQHAPQYFWKPAYQSHRNGAARCGEVMLCTNDPEALAGLFEALQGPGVVRRESGGLAVCTARGVVMVATAERLAARFPGMTLPGDRNGPYFVGYSIEVEDLDHLAGLLGQGGVPFQRADASLWIAPATAFGVLIAFAEFDRR
jgi:catechol 2,3-dioxygenase-like lactoylglutathione lyase family enzyme